MDNEIKWTVDQSHSEISFKVRHLMISHVKGTFKIFDANIYTTGVDFKTVQIDLWIDAASVSTGDEKRDEHLRAADFFDVANHKQISFTASSMQPADSDGNHELWGELTMKGITRNIKLNAAFGGIVNDPWANEKAGFTVTGKFKRSDWELTWNTSLEAGGIMVGDDIVISCEIELINAGKRDMELVLEDGKAAKTVF
jgi:polyisoprenoid-binding protein YceI